MDSNIRSLFSLGNETGVLNLIGGLDFEGNSSYIFSCIAVDNNPTQPLSTVVTVM